MTIGQHEASQPRPVVSASRILGAVSMIAGGWVPFALAFEWITWTNLQVGAYGAFVGVVIGAIALGFGIRVEKEVTPTISPKDDSGAPFVPIAIDSYED